MNKSRTACYLVVALLTSSLVGFGQTKPIPTSAKSTTNGQDVKVKAEVEKLGLETNVTVKMLNTKEYHGAIKIIEDDSFTISEVELNQLIAIKYDEARKVSKGYSLRSKGHSFSEHKRLIGTIIGLAIMAAVATQIK